RAAAKAEGAKTRPHRQAGGDAARLAVRAGVGGAAARRPPRPGAEGDGPRRESPARLAPARARALAPRAGNLDRRPRGVRRAALGPAAAARDRRGPAVGERIPARRRARHGERALALGSVV